jgi:glycosyltransferase involved in cell wall biosynthesis
VNGTRPAVSVVVPAYNVGRFIRTAVTSVLCQTMTDLECVVVDDGSTDDTAAVLSRIDDPRLRVVTKENRGTVADARNAGVATARGELIAFLDGDDWWLPEKLARQVALLEQQPVVGMVYCGYAIADQHLAVRAVVWPDPGAVDLRRQVLLEAYGIGFASTALVPAAVLASVGPFELALSVSEDIDLADRIAQAHAVVGVPECLTVYRTHPGQGHLRLNRYEHDMEWILADRFGVDGAIDRRSWQRGVANLHTRLAVYELRKRNGSAARRHLTAALRTQPSRLALLPAAATLRRVRRWSKIRRTRAELDARIRAALAAQGGR